MTEKDWYEKARKLLIEDRMQARYQLLDKYCDDPVRYANKLLFCDDPENYMLMMDRLATEELSDEQKLVCPELAKEIESKSARMRQVQAAVKDVYKDAIHRRIDEVRLQKTGK